MMTQQEISKKRFENALQFTEAYFLEEVNRFREACGDKRFWDKTDEQQDAMISGLSFCYLNIVNDDGSLPSKEQIDKWAFIFKQALDNYNRRKTMLVMLPLKKYLGIR
jgi:hypothetical protein